MYRDAENEYSDAQAITASAASTNIIDHGEDRNIGIGEPMGVLITVDVAADVANADETYAFAVQTDDNASFSSPTSVVSRTIAGASLTAGSRHVLPLPPDLSAERYTRVYATLGGTTPSITFSAALMPLNMLQNEVAYPSGFTVS